MVEMSLLPVEDYPKKPSLSYINKNFGPPPPEALPQLQHLGKPHVESFNYMLEEGLQFAVEDMNPVRFELPESGLKVSLFITEASVSKPAVKEGAVSSTNNIYPSESRQRGGVYKGKLKVRVGFSVEGMSMPSIEKDLGNIPIMLRSKACHLHGLTPQQLVERGEHEQEWGGYFVVGGHERLLRMLQTTRRNYPIAMKRPSWKNRGVGFSDMGVLLECGKEDLTITKNVLHYLTTGNAKFMFSLNKELFFVPVILILKALKDVTDRELFREVMIGMKETSNMRGTLINMIRELQDEGIFTHQHAKQYIGRSFREKVKDAAAPWFSDEEICDFLMDNCVAINLKSRSDKFSVVCCMMRKLFTYVRGDCTTEGVDSLMMHEVVLGGHIYLQLLKEKMHDFLVILKYTILKKAKSVGYNFRLNPEELYQCLAKSGNLERTFENFVGTGNLPSRTGLGLMQKEGLAIMAENINRMRYMSHFRAIHRGSFFTEMRTTEVRALLPDAWGFICPVHTPDGSPCGLLNHLALTVEIVTHALPHKEIPEILSQLGLIPVEELNSSYERLQSDCFNVMLNGRLMGWVAKSQAQDMTNKLRAVRINPTDDRVHLLTEIAFIPERQVAGQYPGVYIFTGPARMMRPVYNLAAKCIEYIGTLEQVYMEICIRESEALPGLTTHREIRPNAFLSNLACTIPLPDFNQSPRNMYQCQMGKQTMASPIQTWHSNSETKLYRLQTPTSPFFRPAHYDYIRLDDFPMGTNAIVAVISHTGYDMEDAMIINKMSYERGFCAGMIYKSEFVDLREFSGQRKKSQTDQCGLIFARDPFKPDLVKFLDADGLPYPGTYLEEGDPLFCFFSQPEAKFVVKKYKHSEAVFIDSIKLCSNDNGTSEKNKVCITFRIPRNPTVGDKFASRSGQKGICSQRWPCEDIPWTSNGLMPDIIFNPHGFPSRMTIAMMVECLAGKSGAVHGKVYDATPFTFSEDEDNMAIEYFAHQLEKAGYNYYGTETLYSGLSGQEIKAEIFFGIIHYQRLRHMVGDKYQVRSKGPVDMLTRQPVKGRKKGGGVRFGEMERDSLIAHGVSQLLQDRLFSGSDRVACYICQKCGSVLSAITEAGKTIADRAISIPVCGLCGESKHVKTFHIPFICLHLIKELGSANIMAKIGGFTI